VAQNRDLRAGRPFAGQNPRQYQIQDGGAVVQPAGRHSQKRHIPDPGDQKHGARQGAATRRRKYLVSLANDLDTGARWQSPELTGTLYEAWRQQKGLKDRGPLLDLARLLDHAGRVSSRDLHVSQIMDTLLLSHQYHDGQALEDAAYTLLTEMRQHEPAIAGRRNMRALARYWIHNLDTAAVDVLVPHVDPADRRRYLREMVAQRNPGEVVGVIFRRIANISDYDENMPVMVNEVRQQGAVMDVTGVIGGTRTVPSPELLALLESGYRQLLDTRTDDDRQLFAKVRARRNVTYEHGLYDDEERAIRQLGAWMVKHEPDRLLRPLFDNPKFAQHRVDAITAKSVRNAFGTLQKVLEIQHEREAKNAFQADQGRIDSLVAQIERA